MGHNGSGKTTLLKVISGVTAPTRGKVHVSGRVAALIDVIVGFHPDLTGRENAALLGAIFGMSQKEMDRRMDEILEFAEIDQYADTPIKRFSAGMGTRMAFGTLTVLNPEILLIDEVLAVGDASFQRKCINWLADYRTKGGTLLFVSHNLGLVRSMTDRAVWLDRGQVNGDGPTQEVIAEYSKAMEGRTAALMEVKGRKGKSRKAIFGMGLARWGAGGARVEDVQIKGGTGNGSVTAGADGAGEGPGPLEFTIEFKATQIDRAIFCVGFLDEAGREIGGSTSEVVALGDEGSVRCEISPIPLRSGVYFPVVAILSADGTVQDRWRLERAVVVDQEGEITTAQDLGPVAIAASWSEANGERPS